MDEKALNPCLDRCPNHIIEKVKHIDKIQKEIVISNATSCISCDTSLITQANNTIPVSFYMCNGDLFTALVAVGSQTTEYFRIECLRDYRFVTLRLLTTSETVLTCTNQTVILDLDCVCAIQCYAPINCEEC